jgi:phage anti-repressor protein
MKKKLNDMSPDMFNDAMSSTPIPVFTTVSDAAKNDTSERFTKVPEVPNERFTKVPEVSFEGNQVKNQLIKVDFDKQTVSARALYDFLGLAERFSKWFKRMISYGLVENIDFTAVSFVICHKQPEDFTFVNNGTPPVPFGTGGIPLFTNVNNGVYQDIGDYLLTIDAAKHIAMVQRNEKGKQARNYFINIEKLYWKSVYSQNQNPVTSVTPFEKIRNLLVEIEGEMIPQKDYDSLIEKTEGLEKQFQQLAQKNELHKKQMELSVELFSKKVDRALKDFVTEVVEIVEVEEMEAPALRISNPSKVHFSIEKLPQVYRMWYLELSEIFTTTDAERIGEKYHISRTTIFRMLRNKHYNLFLFRKLRCGQYEKC